MLKVQHTLLRLHDGLHLREPKTARTRRRIALSSSAIDALCHHRSRQAVECLRLGPAWEDHDLVLANKIGKPIEASKLLRRSFWPLLTKAELPRIRSHDMRHAAATLLLQQGVHPKVVSGLLGHSSIGLTLDTYSHVIPDMQQKAVVAMDALLRG
jgi:integrase